MPPPITLTLYDKNDDPINTFSRSIVPWGLLKKAMRLSTPTEKPGHGLISLLKKRAPEQTAEEAQMDGISQFVVELFGNQFTVRDLENGADTGEIMAVFRAVVARANETMQANPTLQPPSRKQH